MVFNFVKSNYNSLFTYPTRFSYIISIHGILLVSAVRRQALLKPAMAGCPTAGIFKGNARSFWTFSRNSAVRTGFVIFVLVVSISESLHLVSRFLNRAPLEVVGYVLFLVCCTILSRGASRKKN